MIDKLVSMSFLKDFGDKCKDLFSDKTLLPAEHDHSYIVITENKISKTKLYILYVKGLSESDYLMDAELYIDATQLNITAKCISKGSNILAGVLFTYTPEGQLLIICYFQDSIFKHIEASLIPLELPLNNIKNISLIDSRSFVLPEVYYNYGDFPDAKESLGEIEFNIAAGTSFKIDTVSETGDEITLSVTPGSNEHIKKVYLSYTADALAKPFNITITGLFEGQGIYNPITKEIRIEKSKALLGNNGELVIIPNSTDKWINSVKVNKYGIITEIGTSDNIQFPLASANKIGGILIGAVPTETSAPVELDSLGRAYINTTNIMPDIFRFTKLPSELPLDFIALYIGKATEEYKEGRFYQNKISVSQYECTTPSTKPSYTFTEEFSKAILGLNLWDDNSKVYINSGTIFKLEKLKDEQGKYIESYKLSNSYNLQKLLTKLSLNALGIIDNNTDPSEITTINFTAISQKWEEIPFTDITSKEVDEKLALKADKATTYTKEQTDNAIKQAVSSVYKYIATVNSLPSNINQLESGWVYNLTTEREGYPAGTNWAVATDPLHPETKVWDPLSGIVDISGKADLTYVKELLNLKADKSELNTKLNVGDVYSNSEIDSKLSAKANISDVYRKDETYSLQEINDKLSKIDVNLLVPITYNELKIKRDAGELIPGAQYRITDYVTKTKSSAEFKSAEHPFDIIIVALSKNELSENCEVIQHDSDTYLSKIDLRKWQIKYTINNDTNYEWIDNTCMGVIYWMKDEEDNECPYDFKNMQFKGWHNHDKFDTILNENLFYYTFSYVNKGTIVSDASVLKSTNYKVVLNKFSKGCWQNVLLADSLLGGNIILNIFSFSCVKNIIHYGSSNNFASNCSSNSLVLYNNNNKFEPNCSENIFIGQECSMNSFGNSCTKNLMQTNFFGNTIGGFCSLNTFGELVQSNKLGNNCSNNTINAYFRYNIINNECRNNIIPSGVQNCEFRGVNNNLRFELNPNINGDNNVYRNVVITAGYSNQTINDQNMNQDYFTIYPKK